MSHAIFVAQDFDGLIQAVNLDCPASLWPGLAHLGPNNAHGHQGDYGDDTHDDKDDLQPFRHASSPKKWNADWTDLQDVLAFQDCCFSQHQAGNNETIFFRSRRSREYTAVRMALSSCNRTTARRCNRSGQGQDGL
jgi:hypothetical protein